MSEVMTNIVSYPYKMAYWVLQERRLLRVLDRRFTASDY
jgi:hypothetical protein